MPVISTLGAASSRGFGQFSQQAQGEYIEDYFSTYLYTGTGTTQIINNGIALANTASWTTYQLNQNNSDAGNIALDSSGNLYVCGQGNDGSRTYILTAKYNSGGVLQWAAKLNRSTAAASQGFGVAVDSNGNVYSVGYTFNYAILAKYNSSGSLQWQRKFFQNGGVCRGVAVDSADNIYITGYEFGGVDYYIFIAKYDSTGALIWQRKLNQNSSFGYAIAVDTSSNVYITGTANDGTYGYAIIAKYNSSGTLQWQRKIQTNASEGYGIAVDSSANVFVTGNINSFGHMFVAKYDTSGVLQWQRFLKNASSGGYSVTVDSSGSVYAGGFVRGSIPILAKYNTSGTLQWQLQWRQTETAQCRGIAVDSSGNLFATSQTREGSLSLLISILKLKADGSASSGTAFVTLSLGLATNSVGTATETAGGATSATGTATDSAADATAAVASVTSALATQAAAADAGGLVWTKARTAAAGHALVDTARGGNSLLATENTNTANTALTWLQFTASGYIADPNNVGLTAFVSSGQPFVSWSFKEAEKFFDVVTYTGNGVSGRVISHNLGSTPGMVVIKALTGSGGDWVVQHRSLPLSGLNGLALNSTSGTGNYSAPLSAWSSTTFTLSSGGSYTNGNGVTYVAYLFAHDAGGFGDDLSQNVISCGAFTTNSSGGATVTLGYEPQFILLKRTNSSTAGDWFMLDIMRGMSQTNTRWLYSNTAGGEVAAGYGLARPTATGFIIDNTNLAASSQYIYMTIRRGPMRVPTDGTSVYTPIVSSAATGTNLTTGFPVDLQFKSLQSGGETGITDDRMRGVSTTTTESALFLRTYNSGAESSSFLTTNNWGQNGFLIPTYFGGSSTVYHNMRRAPSFMDIVAFTGTSSSPFPQTVSHNLAAVPELIISKTRNVSGNWFIQYKSEYYGNFGTSALTGGAYWTSVTSSSIARPTSDTNTYIVYLFSSCAKVSKIGKYTGNGSSQTIDCGFSAGARFIMIKRVDDTGGWLFWDSARGIVAGNDPYMQFNSNNGDNAFGAFDDVDNTSSGFVVNLTSNPYTVNANGGTYIFLAIA